MKKALSIAALVCLAATLGKAQLLTEAVGAFPAHTTSLEYDALSKLRALPNYGTLRKQYSGEGLQRVQKDLLLLGVSEDQLTEVVTAAGPNGFFGLLAGNFHAASVEREAAQHAVPQSALEDGPLYCTKDGTCLLLIAQEDGHGFFGTIEQMRAISDVRQGRAASLAANATFMNLKGRMDPQSPVLGFAPGTEIGEWIGPSIPEAISSRLDLKRLFSTIQNFGYSVQLDSKAHVGLSLLCSSAQAGAILRDALTAAGGLQRAAAMAAGPSALPFDHLAAQSDGRLVAVHLDAAIQ